MFKYARADTHFLLYVYDNLRNELIEKSDASTPEGNLIDYVLNKSKEVALQRYERPFYDAQRGMGSGGWFNLLTYSPALFSREQFAVFRAVHQWRDTIARKEDESVNVIMPKHVIFNIAREMPTEMAPLLGCSHPISAPVRQRANELLELIKKAKIEGATGPELKEMLQVLGNDRYETGKAVMVPNTQNALVVPNARTAPAIQDRNLPPPVKSCSMTLSRSMSSSFWGTTVDQSPPSDVVDASNPSETLRLALPMPNLTAEIYASTDTAQTNGIESERYDPGARAEHAYVKDRKPREDDIFILKDISGPKKRKASALDEPPEPMSPNEVANGYPDGHEATEISLNDPNEERAAREKAERRAERKAQKKAEKQRRKLEEQQQAHGKAQIEDEEPFDYENAPSVLHASRDSNNVSGASKAFNPYSKSLDAPKGLGRAQKEMPGKSFTFKS